MSANTVHTLLFKYGTSKQLNCDEWRDLNLAHLTSPVCTVLYRKPAYSVEIGLTTECIIAVHLRIRLN
jgi:hypothetical protein